MKKRASMFILVAVFLMAWPASSPAPERDNSFGTSADFSKKTKPRIGRVGADDSQAVAKLINDINAAAQKDKRRMLSIIVINTNVAATTLEQQKARTGLSLGDIYVAHALSLATRKKFDTIVAMKSAGQSWSQIARAHKVSLRGSTELLKEMMKNS